MTVNRAYLVKGWLLGQSAPTEIMAALDSLIEHLDARQPVTAASTVATANAPAFNEPIHEAPRSEEYLQVAHEQPAPKKKHNWSPEARAAQAERLRARRAAGLMTKGEPKVAPTDEQPSPAPKSFSPVSAERLQRDHNEYAGKRDPQQPLLDSDWPDIRDMLDVKRMSVSRIASDYDVTFGELRAFIDKHEALDEHTPGEAPAPSQGGA